MRTPLIPLVALTLVAGTTLLGTGCGEADPQVDPNISYLSADERLELFDLERSDYILGLALKPFNHALRDADADAIRTEVADGFEARLVEMPTPEQRRLVDRQSYVTGAVENSATLDADGLIAWAEDLREHFEVVQTVWFGRYRNSKEIIEGSDAVATSEGLFRVAGVAKEGGPMEISGTFTLVHNGFERFDESAVLEEQEVDPDRWIHRLELHDGVYVRAAEHLFTEVTETCGVTNDGLHDNWDSKPTLIFTGGSFIGDVNRDGHLDLLVTEILRAYPFMKDIPSTTRLYFGDGRGGFEESGWRPAPPHTKFRNGMIQPFEPYAAIFDATGDGKVDVLHAGVLWTWNRKKKQMVKIAGASPLPNADATLCDYDADGLVDIYFVNSGKPAPDHLRKENVFFDEDRTNGRANQLFRNLGGGKFEDVTAAANASPAFGRTFACVWLYANDDAHPDLFGGNEFGRNVFLVNNGDGTFTDADDVDSLFGGFSMGVASGDMDGDARVDIYVSNMYSKAGQRVYSHLDMSKYPEDARRMFIASVTGNRLYCSRGDLTFENRTAYSGANAVGWGFSGAVFDIDLDGWLDVYAPCGYISVDASKPDG